MKKFGLQYCNNTFEVFAKNNVNSLEQTADLIEIRNALRKFKSGYENRDLQKVDEFIEELFVKGDETYAVGTGTSELFLGIEEVKQLISDDWQYWGDADIDWENARIDISNEVAWFATAGSVKYIFEDTLEKYDRHINVLKGKINDAGLTPKQKIAYINWFLSLVYHQREDTKREYLWPMRFSGVMLKESGKWKFVNLKFSMPRSNFPDERFENSEEFKESYDRRNAMVEQYKSNCITEDIKTLIKSLETHFIGQNELSTDTVLKYFAAESHPYIIAPENQWFDGVDGIVEFFTNCGNLTLSLESEKAIAYKSEGVTSITVTGTLKQKLTEEELAGTALEELNNVLETDIPSKEKLFAAHRGIACAIKESAMGISHTYPIRLTAVVVEGPQGLAFQSIHFSYPFYWILEGKLNNI